MRVVGPATFERFLAHLRDERDVSPETYRTYEKDVRDVLDFLRAQHRGRAPCIGDFNRAQLQEWLASLRRAQKGAPLVNRKRSSLAVFCQYLRVIEVLVGDPCQDLVTPKLPPWLPHFLEEEEALKLVLAPMTTRDPTSIQALRDYAILWLLYELGIRRAEVSSIRLDSIKWNFPNPGEAEVRVVGKKNKSRVLGLVRSFGPLQAYLARRAELCPAEGETALFLHLGDGSPMSPDAVGAMVRAYSKRCGVKAWAHLLRHTCATLMLLNGAEARAVQEQLGHASLKTTTIYTHVTAKHLRDKATLMHPANRDHRPPSPESLLRAEVREISEQIQTLQQQLLAQQHLPPPPPAPRLLAAPAPPPPPAPGILARVGAWVVRGVAAVFGLRAEVEVATAAG